MWPLGHMWPSYTYTCTIYKFHLQVDFIIAVPYSNPGYTVVIHYGYHLVNFIDICIYLFSFYVLYVLVWEIVIWSFLKMQIKRPNGYLLKIWLIKYLQPWLINLKFCQKLILLNRYYWNCKGECEGCEGGNQISKCNDKKTWKRSCSLHFKGKSMRYERVSCWCLLKLSHWF